MSLATAKKAFTENTQKFVSAKTDPAMFNLNIGLLHMVEAIEELTALAQRTKRQVDDIEAIVRRLR